MITQNQNEIFVSYRRTDKDFTRRLVEGLVQHERTVWIDWEDIPPGSLDFTEDIRQGIDNADACVIVLTPEYLESPYCLMELDHAANNHKRLVPVVVKDFDISRAPASIAHINWVYFNKEDNFEAALDKTIAALDADQEYVRAHTRLLNRARQWEQHNHLPDYLLLGDDLKNAEQWLRESDSKDPAPTALHTDYIHRSTRAQQIRTRNRLITFSVTVVILILALVAGAMSLEANRQRRDANEQRDLAQTNAVRAQGLALSSRASILIQRNPLLAIALTLESSRLTNPAPAETQEVLARAAYAPGVRQDLAGHTSFINAVAYSGNGELAATASEDGTVRVWLIKWGRLEYVFEGHAGQPINAVVFNPNGNLIASAGDDDTILLWNALTGEVVRRLEGHGNDVTSLAFSPDGRLLLSGAVDRTARIWNTTTGQQVYLFQHESEVLSVAYSPDARTILTGTGLSNGERALYHWHIATGKILYKAKHIGFVRAVAFVDDQTALSGSWDEYGGRVRRFDLTERYDDMEMLGHSDVISSLAISADRKYAVSGSWDQTVRVWDIAAGLQIEQFDVPEQVRAVAVSPTALNALTGLNNRNLSPEANTVLEWDLDGEAEILRFEGHSSWVRDVAYHPRRSIIASASGGFNSPGDTTIRLWNSETGEPIHVLAGHEGVVMGIDFSPDGSLLVSVDLLQMTCLWEVDTGEQLKCFNNLTSPITSVDFSPDGQAIVTGLQNGDVIAWDVENTQPTLLMRGHTSPVQSVAYSPDGRYIVSGSGIFNPPAGGVLDNTVRLWDAATGEEIRVMEGHTLMVSSVSFSGDSRQIISSSLDSTLRLWDVATGQLIRRLVGHNKPVYAAAFSPDNTHLISAGDNLLILWDLTTGASLLSLEGHTSDINTVAFDPSGEAVVSGAQDNTARVWRVPQTLDELVNWINRNRYVRPLTCSEREIYRVEPLCEG